MAIIAEFILRKARGKPIFERLKKPEFSLQNVLDSLKIDIDADSYRAEKKNFIPINQMALTLEINGEKPKTTNFEEIYNEFQDTENRLFFITGPPLSGKTYFARKIAKKFKLNHVRTDSIRDFLISELTYYHDADYSHPNPKLLEQ